jgi:AraC-like DNA-binding protein
MRYLTHSPGPPLADFVEYIWALRDAPAHSTERIVPSGTLELVVNLQEDALRVYDPRTDPQTMQWRRYSGAVVSGAYRRYFVIDTHDHTSIVGVHFRPGGALPFLGVPPGELADRHVDLETLWGRPALELRERLCAAATAADRFTVLEQALMLRLAGFHHGHPAVPIALSELGRPGVTVGQVAASVDLSRRRLIEVFTAEVGMTPKRLSRVLRFQRVSALARRGDAVDWAPLARVCGYFDQSHLIHDVSEFTGMSPSQLAPASEQVKELHLAVPEWSNSSKTFTAHAHNLGLCGS